MLYNYAFCHSRNWLYLALSFSFFFTQNTLHAQENEEQKSFTAPRQQQEWVFLVNSETSKWEYDRRTIMLIDSSHIRVRLRETPLKNSYCDIRGAKMWKNRSIQGYSDSLRMHPQYYYDGYERYGFTILEEIIDFTRKTYTIRYAGDYDLGGLLIALWGDAYDKPVSIAESGPEKMVVNLFSGVESGILVRN